MNTKLARIKTYIVKREGETFAILWDGFAVGSRAFLALCGLSMVYVIGEPNAQKMIRDHYRREPTKEEQSQIYDLMSEHRLI